MSYRYCLLLIFVAIASPVEAQKLPDQPQAPILVQPPSRDPLADDRGRLIRELEQELTVRCQLHQVIDGIYVTDSLVAIARVAAKYDRLRTEQARDPLVSVSTDGSPATALNPVCTKLIGHARTKAKLTEPVPTVTSVAVGPNTLGGAAEKPVIEQFFPWPPRPPYGHKQVDPALFEDRIKFAKLGAADDFLRKKLEAAGYEDFGYFMVMETGFAIVTKLERISWSGVPDPVRRFDASLKPTTPFNLADYIYRLFHAGTGRYRVFVFVVTDKSWSPQTGQPVDFEQAQTWNMAGVDALPADLRKRDFNENYRITVLLYEFEYTEGNKAPQVSKGSKGINAHLAATHIEFEGNP